ncbi:IclR family transcriptional regulator domain-containing protein [Halarsenatibacter silvermanii]|uniref:IclR family transcriptional regulator domain-containing protein n=1 Tax=Halarsenatibacter silvermanii TaxID=321763 RepID=UPI000B7CE3E0
MNGREKSDLEIRCVAGPIFDHKGEIMAAFGVSGPASRMTDDKTENIYRSSCLQLANGCVKTSFSCTVRYKAAFTMKFSPDLMLYLSNSLCQVKLSKYAFILSARQQIRHTTPSAMKY